MSTRIGFKNSRLQNLAAVLEEPTSKREQVVVIVHGNAASKDTPTSTSLAEALYEVGVHSFRFDQAGCGESEGEYVNSTITAAIQDLHAAITTVRALGYRNIQLFGSSMGALINIATALEYRGGISKLAMLSPVVDPVELVHRFFGAKGMERWQSDGHIDYDPGDGRQLRIGYGFYLDAQRHVMNGRLMTMQQPTLIVHGEDDPIVPLQQAVQLAAELPRAYLHVVRGVPHDWSNEDHRRQANERFVEWFR